MNTQLNLISIAPSISFITFTFIHNGNLLSCVYLVSWGGNILHTQILQHSH